MSRIYSLAQLTTLELSPPEMVTASAKAGYQACGLRLLPVAPGGVAYRLMDDPVMLKETLARMADTGVLIGDIEIIRLAEHFNPKDYERFFEVGQQLGASKILVAGDDPDEQRVTESFARLCEACLPYDLTADIEFMPWIGVDSLSKAQRVVATAGQSNGGVLVDALHFARSKSTLDELAALPPSMIHYAQICDGPAGIPASTEELIHTARCERLLPGEGGLPLADIFKRLPADTLISVEIPHDKRCAEMGPQAWANETLKASRRLIESLD
ncbi:MAG: TIM barrel protein [Alcaligenaceae bacterium]|nr:TIM barrel protein [Alcaligenaceae bacterium]